MAAESNGLCVVETSLSFEGESENYERERERAKTREREEVKVRSKLFGICIRLASKWLCLSVCPFSSALFA